MGHFHLAEELSGNIASALPGYRRWYVDSADGMPKLKDSAGVVTSLQGPAGPAGPGGSLPSGTGLVEVSGGILVGTARAVGAATSTDILSRADGDGRYFILGGALGTPASGTLINCTFPILNQSTSGNAATATALQTGRNINGVLFDGTSNVTVPAAAITLTGTTLPALIGTALTALDASNLTTGTVAAARLGTGSGGATKFLREDSTWQTVAGGGATNLSVTNITATTLDVASDTGTDATIPAATASVAGLATAAQITKLNAITGTNTGDQTITLTGDVTGSGTGSFAATIAAQAVTYSKIQNVSATDKLLGRSTAGAGVVEEIPLTAAGRALIDDADASAQRTTLGLGTLATQSGTFSGTSSGTNTGDQNLFSTITVSGQSNVVADAASDTLTLVAGTNVTITTNAGTDTITIAAAGGGGATNLSVANITATTLDVLSDTGTDATIPAATASVAGLATAAQITKLDGIATGATANSSDATLLARANHTGTQAGSTVTGAYTAAALTLATAKLLGRSTAGTGAAEEITLGTNLSFTGTTLNAAGGSGSTNIFVGAAEMVPRTTNGCGINSIESATNKINYDVLEFDAGNPQYANFVRVLPNNWGSGTITAKFTWTAASGSGDVIWGLQARSYANDDAIDQAFGTAQTSTDTLTASVDMDISPATSDITIGGTVANGNIIVFQVYRDAAAGGDNLGSKAQLIGVEITYT